MTDKLMKDLRMGAKELVNTAQEMSNGDPNLAILQLVTAAVFVAAASFPEGLPREAFDDVVSVAWRNVQELKRRNEQ